MTTNDTAPAVDSELALLEDTLRKTMETHAGVALDSALIDLGWHDMLSEMPDVAIPLVFRLLGETGAHAPVLNDVILTEAGANREVRFRSRTRGGRGSCGIAPSGAPRCLTRNSPSRWSIPGIRCRSLRVVAPSGGGWWARAGPCWTSPGPTR